MDIDLDKNMLENSKIRVIDVRTPMEWKDTGVIPGSATITFFDEQGCYDANDFLKKVDALGGKDIEIVLICRTGSRSRRVTEFMLEQDYNVKNLSGGIMKLMTNGYKLEKCTS